jgi:flagellar biosynthesis/type III secretory pathway chaperone
MTAVNVDALCAMLAEETRVADALAGVLRDERQAIVALRADALLDCLARRDALQEQLQALARCRHAFLAETSGATTPPRIVALLPALPRGAQRRVREAVRRLRRSLLAARSGERQSRALADASLETTAELLAGLRALLPGTRYGADARLAPPAPLESLDRRA